MQISSVTNNNQLYKSNRLEQQYVQYQKNIDQQAKPENVKAKQAVQNTDQIKPMIQKDKDIANTASTTEKGRFIDIRI